MSGEAATPSARTTAEPLAHALDATLSNLMDKKISNFGRAFRNMEARLNRQQEMLNTLEQRIGEEHEHSDAVDDEIRQAVERIHKLMDEKVTAKELQTLQVRMDEMETYIKVSAPSPPRPATGL
jgi:chromosome segregation ATPase